jgi:hypothetical protein
MDPNQPTRTDELDEQVDEQVDAVAGSEFIADGNGDDPDFAVVIADDAS